MRRIFLQWLQTCMAVDQIRLRFSIQIDEVGGLSVVCATILGHRNSLLFELLDLSHVHIIDARGADLLCEGLMIIAVTFLVVRTGHDFVIQMRVGLRITRKLFPYCFQIRVFWRRVWKFFVACHGYCHRLELTCRCRMHQAILVFDRSCWSSLPLLFLIATRDLLHVKTRQSLRLRMHLLLLLWGAFCRVSNVALHFWAGLSGCWKCSHALGSRLHSWLRVLQSQFLVLLNLTCLLYSRSRAQSLRDTIRRYRACRLVFVFDWDCLGWCDLWIQA